MMDAPELLPCPFCGGEAVLDRAMLTGAFRVVCENCGVSTPRLGQVMDCPTPPQERISTAWNRRATPTALASSPEVAKLIAAERARVMRIAASLFPGGYDNNFAKIEAAALKGA